MDSLVLQTGWNVSEVSLILMRLELYGLVTRLPGNRFSAN
jgi:predicted Rossmann fold nucleotide-binding protein DprA/Smf involved in DNA uptake